MTLMELRLGFLYWSTLTFWNTSGGYLTQTFNPHTLVGDLQQILEILSQNQLAPKRYSQEFLKSNWEQIAWKYLLKSKKYWNCKVLLDTIAITITQLNYLFVLHYWYSYCRCLMKLLMKSAQFITNYQKSALGGPTMK